MLTDAVVILERLHCIREKDDESGHSEPYIWPALVWVDATTTVGVVAPPSNRARVVIDPDMRPGESADIVSSVGILSAHVEAGFRAIILVAALWEGDFTPKHAVTAGFNAFTSELQAAITPARLLELSSSNEDVREQAIKEIRKQVKNKVRSVIFQEVVVALPQLLPHLDDIIAEDIMTLDPVPDSSASIPISLGFGEDAGGRLLLYHDASQTGGGDVSNPTVIGQGGWADFRFLFAGANQTIYAVDQDGRLLLYFDASQTGGGDVSNPTVIGQGGWADFRFLFAGANQTIYAVDQDGRLLLYFDASQTGGGDVSNPTVIGQGGWADFQFLFAGANQTIYAVDQDGRLLLYFDASQTGGGDVSNPTVIGQGGWADFQFLFAGANQTIYAVDQDGRLLLYFDASQTGGGDVSNPTVIGQGGWADFQFLFAGANQTIYAVDELRQGPNRFEIEGHLEVQ